MVAKLASYGVKRFNFSNDFTFLAFTAIRSYRINTIVICKVAVVVGFIFFFYFFFFKFKQWTRMSIASRYYQKYK